MKCLVPECGAEGKYEPVLRLWPRGYAKLPNKCANITLNMVRVCGDCAAFINPRHLINEKTWRFIEKSFIKLNRVKPDRKGAEVFFQEPMKQAQ